TAYPECRGASSPLRDERRPNVNATGRERGFRIPDFGVRVRIPPLSGRNYSYRRIEMVINMAAGATEAQLEHVIERVKECGFQPHVTRGAERAIVAAVGSGGSREALEALRAAPGVEDVVPIAHPFKLVSLQTKGERTRVNVRGVVIG